MRRNKDISGMSKLRRNRIRWTISHSSPGLIKSASKCTDLKHSCSNSDRKPRKNLRSKELNIYTRNRVNASSGLALPGRVRRFSVRDMIHKGMLPDKISSVIFMMMQKGERRDKIRYIVLVWRVSVPLFLIPKLPNFTIRKLNHEIHLGN